MKKFWYPVLIVIAACILQAQARPDTLLEKGKAAYQDGNYANAILFYREYQLWAAKVGDKSAEADALRLIGDAFRASNEPDQAVKQLNLSLQAATEALDSALIGRVYNRLSAVYFEIGENSLSERYAQKTISISQAKGDQGNVSNSLNILGAVYRSKGQYPQALDALRKSVEIQKAIGDTLDIPNALNNIANTLLAMEQYPEAVEVAEESYEMSIRTDIPIYSRYAAFVLTEAHRRDKDFEAALFWKDKVSEIDQRIFDETKTNEISKLRAEMDLAQKEKDLELLRNESALKDQTIASKNAQTIAMASVGVMVLAMTVVFYVTWRRQKRANNVLQEKNKQIAQQSFEISSINQHLENAGQEQMRQQKRFEEINKVKDKLFSIISHDLRSPLNSIQGLMSLLKEGRLTGSEFEYMLDTLIDRVENTTMLLDNLLNWSRSQMEGFNAEIETVDLAEIATNVCNMLEHSARLKDIRIHNAITEGTRVTGDRHMIGLVIRNLVSNAIKFTENGGRIQLEASANGKGIHVAVKDDGKGIASQDIDKVMGEDYYFTLGTANEKGSGLGLRLCKEFLAKNNGQLWLEPNTDKGSTFYFSLPAA
ncbi:MAG: tetratricopeptide repeat-containing sensor histidine kinase [Bacteroidetes bacterium]|nr:tetratricopeptide repeat-containing sensor histidine kinase [Bacteroidota bacterium]